MKLNLNFQRSGGLEKNLFCGGGMDIFWDYTIELKAEFTIAGGNAGMWKPWSSDTLKTLGKIWKVKLLPKPVGRAANTSFLRTTCSAINLCSGFKSRTSGKYFRLSQIASLMPLLVKTRSTIFNNYYSPHQSAGKLTCAKALATCGRIHVVEWSMHQNTACSLGNFHSDIPMSWYFLHYSPRSMFKIDTIVTDYDTLWSVRKKEIYQSILE